MFVKIAPKNKLKQKTHFPDLILTLLSIVLYQKVFKPICLHSTQSKGTISYPAS